MSAFTHVPSPLQRVPGALQKVPLVQSSELQGRGGMLGPVRSQELDSHSRGGRPGGIKPAEIGWALLQTPGSPSSIPDAVTQWGWMASLLHCVRQRIQTATKGSFVFGLQLGSTNGGNPRTHAGRVRPQIFIPGSSSPLLSCSLSISPKGHSSPLPPPFPYFSP